MVTGRDPSLETLIPCFHRHGAGAGARPVPYPAPVLRGAGAENLAPARPWWKSSISAHRARPLLVLCLKAFIVLMELKPCLLAVTSWE